LIKEKKSVEKIIGLLVAIGGVALGIMLGRRRVSGIDRSGDSGKIDSGERKLAEGDRELEEQSNRIDGTARDIGDSIKEAIGGASDLESGLREAEESVRRSNKLIEELRSRFRKRDGPDTY
jgi:SMC interacting uncharacterized protein involved in chromosome segregation